MPKLGDRRVHAMVAHFGSAEAAYQAAPDDLRAIDNIPEALRASYDPTPYMDGAVAELAWCVEHDVRVISFFDDDYPYRLKTIPDPPLLLFVRGKAILDERKMVAIVGTRTPTEAGRLWLEQFISDLRPYNPVIISGLAYGIDITAHRQCLRDDLQTIAVLGSGLGTVYPQQHHSVARDMLDRGALVSELVHTAGPDRENFPKRNRIIAGLCDVLIVVESATKGGSMISAKLAGEYHRDTFARPGRPKDTKSAGCNMLIKSHRAQLLESAKDLAYVLQWKKTESAAPQQRSLFVELSDDEKSLVRHFSIHKELTIEKLAIETRLPVSRLSSILLNLEFKGMLKALPGSKYLYIH